MKTFGLLLAVVCAAASANYLKDSTFSAHPDPTGTCVSIPDKIKMGDSITFDVQGLQDMDTETNSAVSSACISTTETQVPDSVGGIWMVMVPGLPLMTRYNEVRVNVPTAAWDWGDDSGGKGSIYSASGIFEFNDGRGSGDPRHDAKLLGSASCLVLIPDRVTTTGFVQGECIGPSPGHYGSSFTMQARNDAYPTFLFSGTSVKECILLVACEQYDPYWAKQLIDGAQTAWTLDGINSFKDRHAAGPAMGKLFDLGNTSVALWQVYRITSSGWLGKNPYHAIGETDTMLGMLNAIHYVTYTLERQSPAFWRVTKDGVTCGDTP